MRASRWQLNAYDSSASRLTSGDVGIRSMGPGYKYWDGLKVAATTGNSGEADGNTDTGNSATVDSESTRQ
jgi:hypothetical protein